jgi:hypothetical protein
MSIDIYWEKLDLETAEQAKKSLNDYFQAVEKPDFIGNITITELSFGTLAPTVILQDLTDPFPDFYVYSDDAYGGAYFNEKKNDTDAQITVNANYDGDLTIAFSTEIKVNYPTPDFMILPLSLKVNRLKISGKLKHWRLRSDRRHCLPPKSHQLLPSQLSRVIIPCLFNFSAPLVFDVGIESEIGDKQKQGSYL